MTDMERELCEALAPIAALADVIFEPYETMPGEFRTPYSNMSDDDFIWAFNGHPLTYGHLRAAQRIVAKARGETTQKEE